MLQGHRVQGPSAPAEALAIDNKTWVEPGWPPGPPALRGRRGVARFFLAGSAPGLSGTLATGVPLVDVRVVLGRRHEPLALAGAAVHHLQDVDQLLLVREVEVELVVVARAEVAHHVPVAEEEHHRHRVVELVHLVEVRHHRRVARIHRCKLRHQRRRLVEQLVHLQHLPGPWVPETHHHQPVFLRENRLVDVPACAQVWQKHRAHVLSGCLSFFLSRLPVCPSALAPCPVLLPCFALRLLLVCKPLSICPPRAPPHRRPFASRPVPAWRSALTTQNANLLSPSAEGRSRGRPEAKQREGWPSLGGVVGLRRRRCAMGRAGGAAGLAAGLALQDC